MFITNLSSDIIYPTIICMLPAYSVRDGQMYPNNNNKNKKTKAPKIFKDKGL